MPTAPYALLVQRLVKRMHNFISFLIFEVFTAVTMKNGVFWDVTTYGSYKSHTA
jgi:type IV secretory pathway VirB3-like protein